MSIWKKFGGCLVLIPIILAIILTLANIGKDNSGFWILGVIFLLILACILSIPAGLLVWIGARKDKKKKEKETNDEKFKFQSFID
ncbi:hypothetical protein [Candidatus Lokiarchaeum ossiferum]|uniref:hypothetical protein n=1 Tax=Candidatus Lokiarchaeum ossiferum TaxID=2951803 RepID=UPI00352CE663